MNLVRWILFLPISIISTVFIFLIVHAFYGFSSETKILVIGVDGESSFPQYMLLLLITATYNGIFVYVGTQIAPIYKRNVAKFLAVLAIVVQISFLVYTFSNGTPKEFTFDIIIRILIIIAGIGTGAGTGFFYDEEGKM